MIKPFSFDELHARIRTLIRRTKENKSPIVNIQTLSINTTMRNASINNTQLKLTPKEYSILEYLAINQGKVISYESIDNHIYTSLDIVTRNTLEAHVSALRKKLTYEGLNDIVKTKRGFGYYIEKNK